jgi:dienelactone hydrolase
VEKFASRSSALSGNVPVTVRTYAEAMHFFDDPVYQEKQLLPQWYNSAVEGQRGVTAGYDQTSATDARETVINFLRENLSH